MGLRINLRLSDDKHGDIINALSNAKNVSEEVRKLLRIAISNRFSNIEEVKPIIKEKTKPKIKELSNNEIEILQQNLMNIDFGFDEDS